MAIKEFIIGPQNYFEQGYFDGDYTLPNVSKSFLECDIDNIKGGRVVTGIIYEDNLIDGTIYHDNSIKARLTVSISIIRNALVNLSGYYEYGYHESGYYRESGSVFTLTAELTPFGEDVFGSGTLASTATMSIAVGKITRAASAMSASFTQTAVGARDRDIDLFAFSNASIAVQVGVIKQNNIAVSSVFSVATDGRRFRDLASAEESLFDLSVINTRSRASSMNAQAAFSLSASAGATLSITSALSSNFSLTVNGGKAKSTAVNLISSLGIQTSRYLGTGRPRIIVGGSGLDFTTISKYGSHALYNVSSSVNGEISLQSVDTIPKANQTWVMEAYLKFVSTTSGNIYFYRTGNFFIKIHKNTNRTLTVTVHKGSATINITTSGNVSSSAFTHVAIVYVNAIFSVFLNGTRSATLNLNDYVATSDPWAGSTQILSPSLALYGTDDAIDEWSMHVDTNLGYDPNSTTITVPTEARINDPATTQFLFHFNNNFADDIAVTESASAALSASSTLSAQANSNTKSASAAITSTATLSINAGKLKTGQASLDITSTQQTTVVKTVTISSNITSAVTTTATGERIKQFTSNQNALFTPSVVVQAQLAGVALLESQFAQTVQAVKTARTTTTVNSEFAVTASTTLSAGLSADTTIIATVVVTAFRIQNAAVALTTEAALVCEFTAFNNVSADLTSTVSMITDIDHLVGYQSNMSSESTVTVSAERTRAVDTALTSTATASLTATRIQQALANFTVTGAQSASAAKTTDVIIALESLFTQSISAAKTTDVTTEFAAIASELATVVKNATGTVTLESAFSFSAGVGIIKRLDSVFSLASTGVQIYGGTARASLGPAGNGIFTEDLVLDRNATISFWAKRNLNSYLNDPQTLFGTVTEGANNTRLVFDYFYNNTTSQYNNVIRWDYYEGGGAASWVFDTAIDDEWHHFLLRMNNNASGGTAFRYWDLWVDGVYISEQRNNTLNNTPRISSQYLSLGYQIPFGPDPDISVFDGALAQLWIGNTNSASNYNFNNNDFYLNGPVDLGPDGRASGYLPAPQIYNNLNDPFAAVNFVDYGVLQKTAPEPLVYTGMVGRFALSTTPVSVLVVTANLTSNTTVTANTVKQVDAQSALNSTATLSCQITQFTGIIANVNSTATVVADSTKINPGAATLAVTVTVQIVSGFFENFTSGLTSTVVLECDFDNVPPTRGEAVLTAQFTVSVDVESFTDSITLMMSMGTITCDATLIPPIRAQADLITTVSLTATIGAIEQFAALTASAGTMLVSAGKITGIIQTISAVSTLACEIKHYKGIILNLPAFNTQLTVGEVINIDPYLTLTITAESRALRILPENREITIESETRVNII